MRNGPEMREGMVNSGSWKSSVVAEHSECMAAGDGGRCCSNDARMGSRS